LSNGITRLSAYRWRKPEMFNWRSVLQGQLDNFDEAGNASRDLNERK
jgi:hypothetical protein